MAGHSLIAALAVLLLFKSGMFVFAAPVPVLFLYTVYGRRAAAAAMLVVMLTAAAAVLFGLSSLYEALYLSYFLATGLILGEGVVRRLDIIRLSGIAVLFPCLLILSAFVMLQFGVGIDLVSVLRTYLSQTMDQVLRMQDSIASFSPAQMAYLKGNISQIVEFMIGTLPAAMILFSLLTVCITVLLTRRLTRRYGAMKYFGNIALQRFPFWPVWTAVAFGTAFFANVYLFDDVYLKFLAVNGLICCAGFFFIEGCFVISFWLHRGRSPFLKFLVYGFIIIFLQVVGFMIIALGLSDQWIDYRKRGLRHSTIG